MRLEYEVRGEGGRELVLLHGLFGNRSAWDEVVPRFAARGYRCVLADLRGHGESPHPPSGYDPNDFADDVAELIATLRLKSPIVVGHSMGGRVGYVLAARTSSPLAGLVIGDIGMEARPESVREVEAIISRLPLEFPDESAAEGFLSSTFSKEEAAYFRKCLSTTRSLRWRFSPGAMLETARLGRGADWISLAPRIRCPALLVRGAQSQELSRSEAARMLTAFPDIEFAEIAGAGHEIHESQPAPFVEIVSSWIERRLTPHAQLPRRLLGHRPKGGRAGVPGAPRDDHELGGGPDRHGRRGVLPQCEGERLCPESSPRRRVLRRGPREPSG